MKTHRFAQQCLGSVALFALFILFTLDAATAAGPFRQNFGPVQQQGRASISDPPGGPLTVSNIGSSGDDGVDFEPGRTRGSIGPIKWMAPEALTGRSLEIIVRGEDAAGGHPDFAWIATCNTLLEWEVRFNPLAAGFPGFTMTLRSQGIPVYQASGFSGTGPLYATDNPPTGATATGVWGDHNGDFDMDHFTFNYPPGTAVVIDEEIYFIDEIAVQFDSFPTEMVALSLMGIRGTEPVGSVGQLVITDRPGGMFGQVMGSLGDAEILGIGSSGLEGVDRLQVSNIGSSGLDGVSMETDGSSNTQAFALEFPQPPAAGKKLFVGGLSWDTDDGSGTPPPVVHGEFVTNSFFDIWTDVSIGGPPVRIEFLLGDEVVGVASDPAAVVRLVTGVQYPNKLGYASTPDGGFDVEFGFAVPVTFNNDGIDDDCDGVRLVHATDPTSPFYPVNEIFVRAADIGSGGMIVTGCPNILEPGPVTPWTSAAAQGAANVVVINPGGALTVHNIGSSGEDGVRLSFPPGREQGVTFGVRTNSPPWGTHKTVLKAFGTDGSKADHGDLIAELVFQATTVAQVDYSLDMSPIGPGPVTWNFYDDGQLVGTEVRGNGEPCFGSDQIPTSITMTLGHPDGNPRLVMQLPEDSSIVLLGGTKVSPAMNKAELIEGVYDASIVRFYTDVTAMEMRGAVHGATFLSWSESGGPSSTPVLANGSLLRLHAAAPNPFNPRTVVVYDLARDAEIDLFVYDLRGRMVRTLFRGHRPAGTFRETWDGLDETGRGVASGTYFFRLSGAGEEQIRKAALVR